jgi:glycosyltransferase involved in cell wall biosynthesis
MAINSYIKNNSKYPFVTKVKNNLGKATQFFYRLVTSEEPRVYFRYRYNNAHPAFMRLYDTPPVKWSNSYNARLLHWMSYADFVDQRPYIVEPNDHPLSAHGWKGSPSYDVSNLNKIVSEARELYENDACRAVILTSEKNLHFFQTYMPEKLWHKVRILPCDVGAIPKKFDWSIRMKSKKVKFLCIASDYDLKGVRLLLEAWTLVKNKYDASLTIVCPKFPSNVKNKEYEDVKLVEKGPITEKYKRELYVSHHVALCPTYVDGGTNIVEAIEYGMPIITSAYHRSESFILNDNGFIVSSPYQYYDTSHYGITWTSVDEYMDVVSTAVHNGEYDSVVHEWQQYMKKYIDDRCLSYCQGVRSYQIASSELSLSFRNESLRGIYKEALD